MDSMNRIYGMALLTVVFSIVLQSPARAEHRFIANQQKQLCIFDNQGHLEWKMELSRAPHDIHRLENGNFLTHEGTVLVEIDAARKEIVWSFDASKLTKAPRVEVHSLQPIPDGNIMVAVSGEGKLFEINRAGEVLHEISLVLDDPHPHSDTRLARRLDDGHYLVAHERDGAVREYDRQGRVVWQYEVPLFGKESAKGHGPEAFGNAVFSALRLPSGNTLIGTGNGHSLLEVNPAGEIVWKVEQHDLPGITLAWVTTLEVHPNGNIVIGNCHAGPDHPQLIEITREKKVVWKFKDFETLGNSVSNSLILDVAGEVIR
jgi:hypothetical protein